LFDPPREDSKEAIAEANAKNVAVKMVTGDNISVARYISGILNIGDDIERRQISMKIYHKEVSSSTNLKL